MLMNDIYVIIYLEKHYYSTVVIRCCNILC